MSTSIMTFCSCSSTHQAATSTSASQLAGAAGWSATPSMRTAAGFYQHRLGRSLLPRRPTVSTRDWVKPAGSMLMLMAGRIVTSELSAFLALKMQMWSNCHCMWLKRVRQLEQSFNIVDTTNTTPGCKNSMKNKTWFSLQKKLIISHHCLLFCL